MARIQFHEGASGTPAASAKKEGSLIVARLMVNGALTAPVAGGVASVEAEIAHGEGEIEALAREMERLAHEEMPEKLHRPFLYEAAMVRECDAIVFLGSYRAHATPMDSGCGLCGGKPDCSFLYDRVRHVEGVIDTTDRRHSTPIKGPLCMLRCHDLGYAIGSALWIAATHFVDAKPMYSAGLAGRNLGMCTNSEVVVGVPLAVAAKNPFVDIPPDYHLNNMAQQVDAVRRIAVIARQLAMVPYASHDPARKAGKRK